MLSSSNKMKCMADSKENWHWDLGNEMVYGNFRPLEKSIWVLEKTWKYVSEIQCEPCYIINMLQLLAKWHFCMFLFSLDALWSKVPCSKLFFYKKHKFLCAHWLISLSIIYVMHQWARADTLTICYRIKQNKY